MEGGRTIGRFVTRVALEGAVWFGNPGLADGSARRLGYTIEQRRQVQIDLHEAAAMKAKQLYRNVNLARYHRKERNRIVADTTGESLKTYRQERLL